HSHHHHKTPIPHQRHIVANKGAWSMLENTEPAASSMVPRRRAMCPPTNPNAQSGVQVPTPPVYLLPPPSRLGTHTL
ncbi:Casein kinase II subunit beta, partial [Dissostichus eleginoides]